MNTEPPTLRNGDRLLSIAELTALLKISRPTLWRVRTSAGFSEAIRLSPGRQGFLLSQVEAWLQNGGAKKSAVRKRRPPVARAARMADATT